MTVRGIKVGDTEQHVKEVYGPSKDGIYYDINVPHLMLYTRFTIDHALVTQFTVGCDSTVQGPAGK